MTAAEEGMLLLSCLLPGQMRPLTMPQLQELGRRARAYGMGGDDPLRELTARDLARLGYDAVEQTHILQLLSRGETLRAYLSRAAAQDIFPVTRLDARYPQRLRQRLGPRCPAVLFAKGDPALLSARCISVVGSRALAPQGRAFAETAGRLILSVPYEDGWTVKINGEVTEGTTFGGCLMAFDLEPGSYEITMKYRAKGATAGILVSAVSVVSFAGIMILAGRRGRRRKPEDSSLRENEENSAQEQEADRELKIEKENGGA